MVVVRGQHYKGICFITPDTAQSKSGSGNVLSRSVLMISQALLFLGEKYYYCQNSDTPPAIPSDSFVSSWGVLCPCCVDVVCSDPQALLILQHYIAINVFNLHENPPHCKQGLFL